MKICKLKQFHFLKLVFVQNGVVHIISENGLQIYLRKFTNTHTHNLRKIEKVVFTVYKWS